MSYTHTPHTTPTKFSQKKQLSGIALHLLKALNSQLKPSHYGNLRPGGFLGKFTNQLRSTTDCMCTAPESRKSAFLGARHDPDIQGSSCPDKADRRLSHYTSVNQRLCAAQCKKDTLWPRGLSRDTKLFNI